MHFANELQLRTARFTYCISIWSPYNYMYTVSQKRPPFSYDCSFYKCWPIFIIFGITYTEPMCNITIIYLLISPTNCCYTTLGNIGCSSKGLTEQSYTCMHKNWCPIFVRMHEPYFRQSCHYGWWLLLSRRRTGAANAVIHSFQCWWCLCIPAGQFTSASCASDGRAPSVWNSEIHFCRLMASKIVLILTP